MKSLRKIQLACILMFSLFACTNPADVIHPETMVVITPAQVTLESGAAREFTATVTGTSNTAVTWSTTGGDIVGTGNTITYTAPSPEGTYSLTATSQADSSKRADATITVEAGVGTPGPSMRLHVSPAALTFTEQGQSMTLEVTAYDEQGQEVALPADLTWRNSDASQVTVTSDPTSPARVTVTTETVPGSAVLSVQSPSTPDIVSPLVVVSSVLTQANAVAIPDSRLAFPTADPRNTDIGTFTDEEIADLLELVDGDTLRYPIILRGAPPQVGEVLFGSESAPILGKVLRVTTRDGLTLAQLEHVGVDEAFRDYAIAFNTEELLDAGVTTSRNLQHHVFGSDLQTLAVRDCELSGSLSGIAINRISPSLTFTPVFEWALRPEHQRLLIGGKAEAAATIGFDAQLTLAGTGTCKVGRPIRFERPIAAGWLAAIMNATIEVDRVIELNVSATGGPRVALSSGYSAELLIQVGFDCTVRCADLSDFTANGEGKNDAIFDINLADGIDGTASVQVGFYLETDAGVQISGYTLLLTCKALDIIPDLLRKYNQKCIQLIELLMIDVFKARAGAEGEFVWDSPTRVLNNRASASIISQRGMATAKLEDDGYARLFRYLGLTPPESISLADLEFTPFTLYKSHSPDTIRVQSKAKTGEVDARNTLKLEEGETVTFTVKGTFPTDLAPLINSPLTRGEVWLSPSKELAGASVSANGDTLTASITVTKELCEEANATLHFLGFNNMLGGIEAAGYLGTVRVSCLDLTGTWVGTWRSGPSWPVGGSVDLVLDQDGTTLIGTVWVGNSPCLTTGSVTGTVVDGIAIFGAVQGALQVTYTASDLRRSGMSGSYVTSFCPNVGIDNGTFSLVRAE